jgi:hypothetical protein
MGLSVFDTVLVLVAWLIIGAWQLLPFIMLLIAVGMVCRAIDRRT